MKLLILLSLVLSVPAVSQTGTSIPPYAEGMTYFQEALRSTTSSLNKYQETLGRVVRAISLSYDCPNQKGKFTYVSQDYIIYLKVRQHYEQLCSPPKSQLETYLDCKFVDLSNDYNYLIKEKDIGRTLLNIWGFSESDKDTYHQMLLKLQRGGM